MEPTDQRFIIAGAQLAPVFLDKEATVVKACKAIERAASQGAKLIVFPEAFISGYPDWVWLIPNSKGKALNQLYTKLVNQAVSIGDEATQQLSRSAKENNIQVIMGMHERNTESSGASLYNSLMFINEQGEIMGTHRKLIPTGGERLIWAQGKGDSLRTYTTDIGKIGGLICWENLMPLARTALYQKGVQLLVAPTWDKSEGWQRAMRHSAREGGCFVISVCSAIHRNDIPDEYDFKQLYPKDRDWINSGNSCVIDPNGSYVKEPLTDTHDILFAEIDLNQIIAAKRMFDVSGHYSRPDVFNFSLKKEVYD